MSPCSAAWKSPIALMHIGWRPAPKQSVRVRVATVSDAEPFQNVTVSLSRKDGRKESFKADPKVLNSAMSVESVGGFYAPGGTRIKLLDGLLVLALLGGLAVPVVHIGLGKILRKKLESDKK